MSLVEDYKQGYIIDQSEDALIVGLLYPNQNPINKVEIGLYDVRAADSILVKYDFDRSGWSILQASVFE